MSAPFLEVSKKVNLLSVFPSSEKTTGKKESPKEAYKKSQKALNGGQYIYYQQQLTAYLLMENLHNVTLYSLLTSLFWQITRSGRNVSFPFRKKACHIKENAWESAVIPFI